MPEEKHCSHNCFVMVWITIMGNILHECILSACILWKLGNWNLILSFLRFSHGIHQIPLSPHWRGQFSIKRCECMPKRWRSGEDQKKQQLELSIGRKKMNRKGSLYERDSFAIENHLGDSKSRWNYWNGQPIITSQLSVFLCFWPQSLV